MRSPLSTGVYVYGDDATGRPIRMIEVNDSVLQQINKSFVIPPQPALLKELKGLAEQQEPHLSDVAELIAKDLAISAAILKTINSPAFGLARSVSDIRQAVMFLGLEGAFSLVQGLKLKEAFGSNKCSISLERFWDNSALIADVAMYIGNLVKIQVPVEDLYTLGLFHDCGVPPMAIKYQDYGALQAFATQNIQHSLPSFEDKKYKTSHPIIGYYLATTWHLPKNICKLILHHHDMEFLDAIDDSQDQICFAVLKMAENIVHEERDYSPARDWFEVRAAVLDVLGLTEYDYNDIKEDISEIIFSRESPE